MGDSPILLVEDDPDDVDLLRRALEIAQVKRPLVVFDTAEEAMAYLAGEGRFADRKLHPLPSLALIDLRLGGLPGHEVIEWIRKRHEFDAMKIIVMSSLYDEGHRAEAYRLGANSYLVKSSSFAELVEKVKNIAQFWPGAR